MSEVYVATGSAVYPPVQSGLPLGMSKVEALRIVREHFRPQIEAAQEITRQSRDIDEFARTRFYVPETRTTMALEPYQKVILEYIFDENHPYQEGGTVLWSQPKKSGKTAVAALVARWIAETWGNHNEVYCVANDQEQARGRAYAQLIASVEDDPLYNKKGDNRGWKIIEREAMYESNNTFVRALSSDYRGEAGSNPTATFWTELWAYNSLASRRLWEELTPVPTRKRSIRYVETYAGFTDESTLLMDLYQSGLRGRRLTHDDIDWPFKDQPPIWVDERARRFMYWDSGWIAHRMPWQTPEYYEKEAASEGLRPEAFDRLHLNLWTSSIDTFIPIEWWEACRANVPPLDNHTPCVLGVDAGITNDCIACSLVSRDPEYPERTMVRGYRIWYPLNGKAIDFSLLDAFLREACKTYNIVQIAYDQYQLHYLMTQLTKDAVAWCKVFSQNSQREVADKQLYDIIRDKLIRHNVGEEATEHIRNAASKDQGVKDRMRIVKKANDKHVDFTVATSMAASECLRLNL